MRGADALHGRGHVRWDDGDAGHVDICFPLRWYPAGGHPDGENRDVDTSDLKGCRAPCPLAIRPCSAGGQPNALQGGESLGQTFIGPVEDVVVRQTTDIDVRGCQGSEVGRAHPVVDPFARPWLAPIGDRGLQVDHPCRDIAAFQSCQHVSPYVGGIDGR